MVSAEVRFEAAHLERLFGEHVEERLARCATFMAELGIDCLVLGSGCEQLFFEDDQTRPFRTNAMFAFFCPLEGPGHWLRIEPGKKPVLARHVAEDYWHAAKPFPAPLEDGLTWDWTTRFELRQAPSVAAAFDALGDLPSSTVFLGEDTRFAAVRGIPCNPFLVLSQLQWMRSFKSDYEVACISSANRLAALGHRAALERFLEGGSEFDILLAYLAAVGQTEAQLPYQPIIGLDAHGAVLHYQYKDQTQGASDALLIDAGARYGHYGSDVTRTHAASHHSDRGQGAAGLFRSLIAAVDAAQQCICSIVKPGIGFADLQIAMHRSIAGILKDAGIIRSGVDLDSPIAKKITVAFIPHGIGHLLGLFVHDVAGHAKSPRGEPIVPAQRVPHLRSYRTLEPGMVLTVEPGLYFIDLLLERLQTDAAAHKAIDWAVVAQLKGFGGIRIEDNILVTATGHRNLTREFVF